MCEIERERVCGEKRKERNWDNGELHIITADQQRNSFEFTAVDREVDGKAMGTQWERIEEVR